MHAVRFWLGFHGPLLTWLGILVSDREQDRAFRNVPSPRLTIEERAEMGRKAEAFSKRWSDLLTSIILLLGWFTLTTTAVVAFILWLASLAAAHAGSCRI
jgi:hypothetical protein